PPPLENRLGNETGPEPAIRRIGKCTLDLSERMFRDDRGRHVRLTRAEVALLTILMDNASRVLSRAQLCHAVFGRGAQPYDRSIDMLVARLRGKIEQDSKAPPVIVTVPGLGYKFTAQLPSADHGSTDLLEPLARPGSQNSTIATYREGLALPNTRAEKRQLNVVCCSLGQSARFARLDPEDFDAL